MTFTEVIFVIFQSLAFLVLYVIIGFGPGFVAGMLLANRLFGKGQPTYMDSHEENKRLAAQHNAQWVPSHERWQRP